MRESKYSSKPRCKETACGVNESVMEREIERQKRVTEYVGVS